MTVINTVINPATEQEDLKAKGIIKRILIKRINQDGSAKETLIKNGPKKGSKIVATHRYSVILEAEGDEKLVGFGEGEVKNLKYENQFQVKVGENYKDLVVGQEISIYPVTSREYEQNGEVKVAYNGKRKDIKILTEAPVGAAASQATPASQGGKTVKVYGEITEIQATVATVNDEKNGNQSVILTEEQLSQVTVGGRMTAYIAADGTVTSGFKAYGAVNSTLGNHQFKPKKIGYDPVGVATGHAINGLGNLLERGFKGDEMETAKLIHTITDSLKQKEASRSGKSVDEVGATVGNAVLNACRRVDIKSRDLESDIVSQAELVLQKLSGPLYDFISASGKVASETHKESTPEPAKPQDKESLPSVQETPPIEAYDGGWPPMDFDDDVPF